MNTKLLVPVVALALLASGVSYGTFAFFADTETSIGNLFSAGTLDLTTNGAHGTTATIGDTSFAPGDTASGSVVLARAVGTLSAVDLDFRATMAVTDDSGGGTGGACSEAEQMDKFIALTTLSYDGTDLLPQVVDADADGRISLDDLETLGVIADLADPGTGGKTLAMAVQFASDSPSCNQADSVDMTLTFLLAQVTSPDLGVGGGGGSLPPPTGDPVQIPASLPTGTYHAATVWTGSKVLVMGGYAGGGLDTVYEFDPLTGNVTLVGNIPAGRWEGAEAWDGTYAYIFGGRVSVDGPIDNKIIRYDPATNVATTMPDVMPDGYAGGWYLGASAVWVGDYAYVGGANGYEEVIHRYEPGHADPAQRVTDATTLPSEAGRIRSIVYDGNVTMYVFTKSGHVYTCNTDTINTAGCTKKNGAHDTFRNSYTAVWGDGYAYIVSGNNNLGEADYFTDIIRYDPVNDVFETMTSAPSQYVKNYGAVWADNRVYVVGGYNSGYVANILQFAPSLDTVQPTHPPAWQNAATTGSGGHASVLSPDGSTIYVANDDGDSYWVMAYNAVTGADAWGAPVTYDNPAVSASWSDDAQYLAISPDGASLYVTGRSRGTDNQWDVATIAYNTADGTEKWASAARYDGAAHGTDEPYGIAVSPDGASVYVAGWTYAPVGGSDNYDGLVLAYNAADGTEKWTPKTEEGPGTWNDGFKAVDVSPDSAHVYVTGYIAVPSGGPNSWLTLGINAADGTEAWRVQATEGGWNEPYAVKAHSGGNTVFVTGQGAGSQGSVRTIAYDVSNLVGPDGNGDFAPAVLWSDSQDTSSNKDIGYAMVESPDGTAVYVTGDLGEIWWTMSYNAATGVHNWASAATLAGPWPGNSYWDDAKAITVSPDGTKLYVAGEFRTDLNGDEGNTELELILAAFDASTGNLLWKEDSKSLAGSGASQPTAIHMDPGGARVYVSGQQGGKGLVAAYATT